MALCLGEQLIIDPNITVRRATHKDLALSFLHIVDIVIINLTVVRATEYFHA